MKGNQLSMEKFASASIRCVYVDASIACLVSPFPVSAFLAHEVY